MTHMLTRNDAKNRCLIVFLGLCAMLLYSLDAMQKLRQILPVWELGFALIWLACASMVLELVEAFGLNSLQGLGVVGSTSACCLGVGIYWSRWWCAKREYVAARDSKPLIPRKYVVGVMGFVLIMIVLSKVTHDYAVAQPEYKESQDALRNNSAVISSFGAIQQMESDSWGYSVTFTDKGRDGAYQFKVKGAMRDGTLRVTWRRNDSNFVPTKIEEVTSENPELEKTIWSGKED